MASGSFNIDTFSWYRSLPLSNDTTPFSTLTMFAVGPSSFMKNYTFYDYTWANGFPDTSTFSVSITSFVDQAIKSTTQALGKVFMSTIPYTKWVSSGNTYQYPVSGGVAETYDFTSSFNGTIGYPLNIPTPSVWLGEGLTRLINSQQYNVFVDCQYSLYLSSQFATVSYDWVSTVGKFINPAEPFIFNVGRTQTTRMGMNQYIDVHTKLMFAPQPAGSRDQIVENTSSFFMDIYVLSTQNVTYAPEYNIFVPGNNNLTFTLVPAVSSVTVL